jgi:NAD(P)-dependent dehydrogenase (short-subunit alcohol dehydrogenase family)
MITKTVLVTGGSSGLGLEAGSRMAAMGHDVVLVVRDAAKGDSTLQKMARRPGATRVSVLTCDLSSLANVRQLAAAFRARHTRLDVLINNAGTVSPERRTTEDGYELTFAVNHLAAFLLTNLLFDLLHSSAPARIVTVSSAAHRSGQLDFDNLHYEKGGYAQLRAYSRSKLANVLFTRELARRWSGSGVTANCLHPGAVATNIWSHTRWYVRPLLSAARMLMLSPEAGADRIVYLATSASVEGLSGGYYEKNTLVAPSAAAQDATLAERLWAESARLTGVAPI